MKCLVKPILSGVAALLLAGCQTPAVHGLNFVLNAGTGLSDQMQGVNVSAVVAFDEAWAGSYGFAATNALYTQGIIKGTPEYGMRVVRINMRHPEYGAWISAGEKAWHTGAMVPDHIGPLKANDYVEIRQTGSWRTMEDFVSKGEGNVVLRVLCRYGDPDYFECAKKLPRIGEFLGFGETGTPYPQSLKEYGFTFTPKYDNNGKPLR